MHKNENEGQVHMIASEHNPNSTLTATPHPSPYHQFPLSVPTPPVLLVQHNQSLVYLEAFICVSNRMVFSCQFTSSCPVGLQCVYRLRKGKFRALSEMMTR